MYKEVKTNQATPSNHHRLAKFVGGMKESLGMVARVPKQMVKVMVGRDEFSKQVSREYKERRGKLGGKKY